MFTTDNTTGYTETDLKRLNSLLREWKRWIRDNDSEFDGVSDHELDKIFSDDIVNGGSVDYADENVRAWISAWNEPPHSWRGTVRLTAAQKRRLKLDWLQTLDESGQEPRRLAPHPENGDDDWIAGAADHDAGEICGARSVSLHSRYRVRQALARQYQAYLSRITI